MVRKIAFTLLAALVFSFEAKADAYCFNESVYYLIVKGDDIFFTTSKSCQSWCAVNASWSAEAKKRAYASLLAAKMSERSADDAPGWIQCRHLQHRARGHKSSRQASCQPGSGRPCGGIRGERVAR
jgi:hypothetical protein